MCFATLFVFTLCLERFTELAPGMGHAANMAKTVHGNNRIVASIAIGLQVATKVIEQALRYASSTTRIVVI